MEGERASWGRLPTLRPAQSLDRTRPSVPLVEPAASRGVGDHDISCMIIYWIWLQSYLNAT